ncbi:MAG: hypothetical protein KDC12_08610 [Flavobacteriales bacterium]|nr:hypothetical protein [Flavobacteriales bacterium]
MNRLLLFILFILTVSVGYAIPSKILIYGYVELGNVDQLISNSRTSPERLNEVDITVMCGDEVLEEKTNRSSGFYSLVLEPGKVYTLRFSKENYFQKLIQIDATEVPSEDQAASFKLFTDVMLFEETRVEDASSFTLSPMAKCSYNSEKGRLEWDIDHAKIAFDNFLMVTGYEPSLISEQ